MLVPLYGFVQGDTIGVLVLAHHGMRMDQVAEMLRDSVRVRVPVDGKQWELYVAGEPIAGEVTVAEAGLQALARIDLRERER